MSFARGSEAAVREQAPTEAGNGQKRHRHRRPRRDTRKELMQHLEEIFFEFRKLTLIFLLMFLFINKV
ncbi:hypothetical protein NQ315_017009 [Exocentrus adspersus]|uniref:Uncharacterized protein n=1 Tax=Exocentrus adspersus TaxID=1586481 RepID=A0AAV8VB12_9CUCU|nr:hypothetical protein NQ315_017009 [Exocentrus adspersus]